MTDIKIVFKISYPHKNVKNLMQFGGFWHFFAKSRRRIHNK